ncbi:MAG TPA: hypothetical protein VHC48_16000, partial [Puia sp.]|nr:hypothetical protein [Puia sp.]
VAFKFTDRGRDVPLSARLALTNDLAPLSLFIKGSTSRFSTINDGMVNHIQYVYQAMRNRLSPHYPYRCRPFSGIWACRRIWRPNTGLFRRVWKRS